MISSVVMRPFQIPRTDAHTLTGESGECLVAVVELFSLIVTACVRISLASASIERPWLAACIRSFCFTGSARFRIVNVVLMVAI